jgi:CHAT domain-containing protein
MAGAILNNLSLVHDELGDYAVSLAQYRRVLELYRGQDFPRGEGDTLGNMGGVYLILGRYREALDLYHQALAISLELDSPISLSQDHGNIALANLGLGQVEKAVGHLDLAIAFAKQAGMLQDEAFWMRHKGNALILMGRHDQGLASHREALGIYERLDGDTEKIGALHDLGRLYLALGDAAGAEQHYRQSMELAMDVGVSREVTANLLALGDLQARQQAFDEADLHYGQAIQRARESGEMTLWTRGLLRTAASYRARQRLPEAREATRQALRLARETGATANETEALFAMAELHRLGGEPEHAEDAYVAAASLLETAPNVELEWKVHYGRGLVQAQRGDRAAAIASLQAAIIVIEGVRDRLAQERFRAGYVQDKYRVYEDLVRLQLEAGREQQAFSNAERLRSRSYLDLIANRPPADPGEGDLALEYELRQRILALRRALAEEQNHARPDQRQVAIDVYSRELLDAEQAYQAFLDERERAKPVHGRDQVPTYADVGARLEPDEALLEYVVGADHVMLFFLTRDELVTRVIPLRRQDLDSKVELVRNLISRRDDERWKKPAASLAASLIAPLTAEDRLAAIRHLYLVPHGTLNYLPFALLPLEEQPDSRRVVEAYTLAYLPTAAALLVARPSPGSAGMLAVAPARSGLAHAGAEARAINAMFKSNSKALLGEAATESAFKREAGEFRLLHLATHGYFNKLNPMLSGLELESDEDNDGMLELHEILGLELKAELVTLSACQTGLGSGHFAEVPAGDDFVGLTRAFLYAGSTSVMATLWEVDDASTLDLMKQFYGGLQVAGSVQDKADALAQAQRKLLSTDRYKHPYYWAPFLLVGEMDRAADQRS